jgi:hypothetical protein
MRVQEFSRLTEIVGIRAVVHDAEVFRRARRCGAHPSDDCRFFRDRFERRSNDDLHTFGFLTAGDLLGFEPIRLAAVTAMSVRKDLVIGQVSI